MKRLILISAILLALRASLSPAPAEAGVSVSVGFSFFHDELAPYGEWVTVADFGEVWRPLRVAAGWQPYLNGKWCYTEYGWTWVSFDPWGGDPYHYGTWVFDRGWGWLWVPGEVWAPAWVTWCDTGSYIGWAPVPPDVRISLTGYSGPAVVAPPRSYVFVPTREFVDRDVRAVRVDPARNAAFVSSGRRITGFAVSDQIVRTEGPPVGRIRKATGSPVRTVDVRVAKTSAVPIAKAARAARSLPVVMPRSERTHGKNPAVSRAETKPEAAVRGRSRTEANAEPTVRHEGPPRGTKTRDRARHEQSPHVAKAQPAAPHEKAMPRMASQPAPRPPAPEHESKAQPPPKRPGKHEGREKNGG